MLETGSGKTLIASLLMEWTYQQSLERDQQRLQRLESGSIDDANQQPEDKKLMFFVVNSYVSTSY